jgi:hypothetical protein
VLKDDPFAQDVVEEANWWEIEENKDDVVSFTPDEPKEETEGAEKSSEE